MKLMSGGDGVILRCEVDISGLSATFGVVFWPYHFQMSSDGPVLCRIGKPMLNQTLNRRFLHVILYFDLFGALRIVI